MKTDTREKIAKYIQIQGQVTPHELVTTFGITQAMVHRHLNRLLQVGTVQRVGQPPKVFYIPAEKIKTLPTITNWPEEIERLLEKEWCYLNPDGVMLFGVKGFLTWAQVTGQDYDLLSLAKEYSHYRQNANKLYQTNGLIDATQKVVETFDQAWLDKLYYQDFYSLPKFGKTKLGTLVLHAKQSQSFELIEQLTRLIQPKIDLLVDQYKIEAVGYIPHSIKRKLEFLPTIKARVKLNLPEVKLEKAYVGGVPIAQKSLSRLVERIENAKNSIFIRKRYPLPKRVLLIDDAVGSGATLNETAKKLKQQYQIDQVIGFAIVGSLKGFPVITEV